MCVPTAGEEKEEMAWDGRLMVRKKFSSYGWYEGLVVGVESEAAKSDN
jgi:hypothetical protein